MRLADAPDGCRMLRLGVTWRRVGLVAPCAALAILGCHVDGPTDPGDLPLLVTITASAENKFTPEDTYLMVGGAAIWKFEATGHNVIFTGNPGSLANIEHAPSNTQVNRTFSSPGVFQYYCNLHEGMTGVVRVVRSASELPEGPS